MKDTFIHNLSAGKLLLVALWVLLWVIPWTAWFGAWPWLRLGLALLIFMIPGFAISLLLAGERLGLPAHFMVGLAVSVLIVSALGLLGRVVHLPFDYIRPVFALAGLIGLVALHRRSGSEPLIRRPERPSVLALAIFLPLAVLGILANLQSRFDGDDFSYLAYLTAWQHAQPLDFHEIIFASGGLDALRFWTAMFPMTTAFLSQISNLHGLLLLGLYLEPFLIILGLLAAYNLYRELLPSMPQALAALLWQFTFLYLLRGDQQPGSAFFVRLSEDKAFAAFVLAPVFFLALRLALESLTLRTGLLFLLTGLSISLVHPVILAYSLFVAGVYAGVVTLLQRDYRKLALLAFLMALTLLPSAPLRFVRVPSTPKSFDLESALDTDPGVVDSRISYIKGTPFYGFKLERIRIQPPKSVSADILGTLFSWGYLSLLLLGFGWSLASLRRHAAAPFVGAASLLVIVCAIPYTGWLMGYFVTARMLWRSPWLMPIGLSATVIVVDSLAFALRKIPASERRSALQQRAALGLALAGWLVLTAYYSVRQYAQGWQMLSALPAYTASLERTVSLGAYLEQRVGRPSRFIASRGQLLDFLPGLSSKSKVPFFRSSRYSGLYIPDVISRGEMETILSTSNFISLQKRSRILTKYQIEYILTLDAVLKDYYARHSRFFRVEEFNDFWIIKFRGLRP